MGSSIITDILARPIFDGGARLSLEVVVTTESTTVRAAPSHSDPRSSGKYEINHFPEDGVKGCIKLINSVIRERLIGMNAADQELIDDVFLDIDGTDTFDNIGGNTAESVSLTIAKAAAASHGVPLYKEARINSTVGVPHIMPNIIGGGATMGNEGWKGRTPDIQDHIILPVGCKSFYEEMEAVCAVYHRVGILLQDADLHYTGGRDEEYCWLPGIDDINCLAILEQASREVAGMQGISFRLGLDVGAADLWDEIEGVYHYTREGVKRSPAEHARHLAELVEQFNLFYMEDSFYEDHVDLYIEQMQQFGDRVLIAGDDLLAGNSRRLEQMVERGAVNCAVIKLNMAGTVSRARQFVEICKSNGITTIGSCRTYDSPDDTLSDLIVAWGCQAYKCGSPAGGEHAAKQNRFLRIDEELGNNSSFNEFCKVMP